MLYPRLYSLLVTIEHTLRNPEVYSFESNIDERTDRKRKKRERERIADIIRI